MTCGDMVPLSLNRVFCKCGKSHGALIEDSRIAFYNGHALPLVLHIPSLKMAINSVLKKDDRRSLDMFIPSAHDWTFVSEAEIPMAMKNIHGDEYYAKRVKVASTSTGKVKIIRRPKGKK